MESKRRFAAPRIGEITQDTKKSSVYCLYAVEVDDLGEMLQVHLEDFLISARESGLRPFPDLVLDSSIRPEVDLFLDFDGFWVIAETESKGRFGDHVQIQHIETLFDSFVFGKWNIKPTDSKMPFGKNEGLLLVGPHLS